MSNIFIKVLRERKKFFIASFLFVMAIGAAVNVIKPEENILNFILVYIVSPLLFGVSYISIEKYISKKGNKNNIYLRCQIKLKS